MEIASTIADFRNALKGEIAFVPTMGNLHEGHLALVRIAKGNAPCVAASIFVNRLQFGAGEDFERYPRTFEQDCEKLEAEGVDVLFAPSEAELYPVPQQVTVSLPKIAEELCGAARPGHFNGMATVVLKLLNIARPAYAVFGRKDYQQLHLVKQMVSQFNLPTSILEGGTVREKDGLAMSSRNRYLSEIERMEAPRLYHVLREIAEAIASGNADFHALENRAKADLQGRGWQVDYVEIRHADTLETPQETDTRLVALGAARLGRTRLIDNICL
jgi:pantoate--beta-alanine ligase